MSSPPGPGLGAEPRLPGGGARESSGPHAQSMAARASEGASEARVSKASSLKGRGEPVRWQWVGTTQMAYAERRRALRTHLRVTSASARWRSTALAPQPLQLRSTIESRKTPSSRARGPNSLNDGAQRQRRVPSLRRGHEANAKATLGRNYLVISTVRYVLGRLPGTRRGCCFLRR